MDKEKNVVVVSNKGHPKVVYLLEGANLTASDIADIREAAGGFSVSFLKLTTGSVKEIRNELLTRVKRS